MNEELKFPWPQPVEVEKPTLAARTEREHKKNVPPPPILGLKKRIGSGAPGQKRRKLAQAPEGFGESEAKIERIKDLLVEAKDKFAGTKWRGTKISKEFHRGGTNVKIAINHSGGGHYTINSTISGVHSPQITNSIHRAAEKYFAENGIKPKSAKHIMKTTS